MILNKAYKFRLYPNEEQKELINKTLGCTRLNLYAEKPYLKAMSLRYSLFDLDNDILNYLKRKI